MSLWQQLTSGQANVYAQYLAFLSIPLLIITGFSNLITSLIIWSVIAIIASIIILFLEVPFCVKCCPTSPRFDGVIKSLDRHMYRCLFYAGVAVCMWFAVSASGGVFFVLSALCLSGCAVGYLIALFKKEERDKVVNFV